MTSTEKWVRDADVVIGGTHMTLEESLLNPDCWKDCGNTRGWERYQCDCGHQYTMSGTIKCEKCGRHGARMSWVQQWVEFTFHLADGKTIEEALKAIE